MTKAPDKLNPLDYIKALSRDTRLNPYKDLAYDRAKS